MYSTVRNSYRTLNSLRCRMARTAVVIDDHEDVRSDTRKTRRRGRWCAPLLEDRENIVAYSSPTIVRFSAQAF